jgi:hypothetical protein
MTVFELSWFPSEFSDEQPTLGMFQSMESAAKFFGCDPGEFSPVDDRLWHRKPTYNETPEILHHDLYITKHEVKP